HSLIPRRSASAAEILYSDVSESHDISVTEETDVAAAALQAGMIPLVECSAFAGFLDIAIENYRAVKNDFDFRSFDVHFLEIPLPHRFKMSALGWYYTIHRSMVLIGFKVFVFLMIIVNDLQFDSLIGS